MKRLGVGRPAKAHLDRFPEVIVTVASDADVIEAGKLARSRGLRISVRVGEYTSIPTSLRARARDGGMLIDLSQFNGIARLQFAI